MAKQFILNVKFFIGNPINILLCVLIIIFSLLVSTIFVPLNLGAGLIYSLSLLPICGIFYSSIHFNVRKSTMYSNITLTKNNRWTFNGSILFSMLLLGYILSTFIFVAIAILNQFNMVLIDWFKYVSHVEEIGNKYYSTDFELYVICVYASLMASLTMFSISFMISHVIKSQKTYFIIIVSLTILMVIFGGTFNDYWSVRSPEAVSELTNPLFPWEIYWVGMVQPLFSESNIISTAYDARTIRYGIDSQTGIPNWTGGEIKLFAYLIFNKNNPTLWRIQNILSYVQIVGYIGVGLVISKLYTNK